MGRRTQGKSRLAPPKLRNDAMIAQQRKQQLSPMPAPPRQQRAEQGDGTRPMTGSQRRAARREAKAATKIQALFRGHQGRKQADGLRSQRQQDINATLTDDTHRVNGRFTMQTTFRPGASQPALAGQTLFRRKEGNSPDGVDAFTSYVQYDQQGAPVKRVDLTGAPHMDVPTPHVLEYRKVHRQTPGGTLTQFATPDSNAPRPAYPWELPNHPKSQQTAKTQGGPTVDPQKSSNPGAYRQIFAEPPPPKSSDSEADQRKAGNRKAAYDKVTAFHRQ